MRTTKTIDREQSVVRQERKWRLLNEIAFSIYFPVLAIWANAQRAKVPWAIRFQTLIEPTFSPHSFLDTGLKVSIHVLLALSAMSIFFCLRVLTRISWSIYFERIISGSVALAGFPIAFLYANQRSGRALDLFETMLAFACGLLYALKIWRIPISWIVVLLFLHFGLWALYASPPAGPGLTLLWFGFTDVPFTHGHPNLIYPLLGFGSSLIWIRYSGLGDLARPAQTDVGEGLMNSQPSVEKPL
jgi:hypothetical protein